MCEFVRWLNEVFPLVNSKIVNVCNIDLGGGGGKLYVVVVVDINAMTSIVFFIRMFAIMLIVHQVTYLSPLF